MTEASVPASSANLGPGFDAVALALSPRLVVREGGSLESERHPAAEAHRAAGGDGRVSVESAFPGGRGLGYSGAARVGGALLALSRAAGGDADRERALEIAVEGEGHAENAAASLEGGLVVAAGSQIARVPIGADLRVVLWIPDRETSTDRSRRVLPEHVPFADAVFNVGHASLLVAAFVTGDLDALRVATTDRLHQDLRFEPQPDSRVAWESFRDRGAPAWLSGSGPSVAALCTATDAPTLCAAAPAAGRTAVVEIDADGARVT